MQRWTWHYRQSSCINFRTKEEEVTVKLQVLSLCIISTLFSCVSVASQDFGQVSYSGSYALLIGEGNYRSGWPVLPAVRQETEQLGKQLEKLGFKVTKAYDITASGLRIKVEEFIREFGSGEQNRLIVFFSGHGESRQDGTKGYFVPVDVPLKNADEGGFIEKAISMEEVRTWARAIKSKHVLFIFDSCFSGTVFTTDNKGTVYAGGAGAFGSPVRQFITAGSAFEKTPGKSVFIPILLRGLQGDADLTGDGIVTGTELGLYIKREMARRDLSKTPQFDKLPELLFSRGKFLFGPYSVAPGNAKQPEIGRVVDAASLKVKLRSDRPLFSTRVFESTKVYGEALIAHGCWEDGCVQWFLMQDEKGTFDVISTDVLSGTKDLEQKLRGLILETSRAESNLSLKGFLRGTRWAYVRTPSGKEGYVDADAIENVKWPKNPEFRISFAQRLLTELALKELDVDYGRYSGGIDGRINEGLIAAVLAYKKDKNDELIKDGLPKIKIDLDLNDYVLRELEVDIGCWDGC
jgi:Caspase domain